MARTWTLLGPNRKPFASTRPGLLGGHRGTRIFGRLDCPSARRLPAEGICSVKRESAGKAFAGAVPARRARRLHP